jgi:hypothetical protein
VFSTKFTGELVGKEVVEQKGPKRTSKVLRAWCEKLATMVVAAKPFCHQENTEMFLLITVVNTADALGLPSRMPIARILLATT